MTRSAAARPFAFTLAALVLLLLWDASGLDLALARLSGTPAGFPLRDNWFLIHVVHEGARDLSWLLVIALLACIRWPLGFLRRLRAGERAQLALSALASVLVVSLVKQASGTSCPWDLQDFGGVAQYVSHWSWGVADGGPGGCFPAGHASAAFAYLGGFFVLRRISPAIAGAWLGVALVAGIVLGLGQQLRGAHYMSHTLWSAWVCWVVGFAIDVGVRKLAARRAATAMAPTPPSASPKLNES